MKKPIISAAICTVFGLAFMGSQALAQSRSFSGLEAGLRLNVAESQTKDSLPGIYASASDVDTNLALQVQYNWPLGSTWLVGLGGTLDVGDLKAGKYGARQTKTRDSYSLYVAPGYALNDTIMAYGKLAYLNTRLESGNGSSLHYDNGYGYGLGLQVMYNKHWYGQAELMINEYDDRSPAPGETVKLRSGIYSLTAGYRF